MTSAMSVAIATSSAWIQRPIEVLRGNSCAAELGQVLAGRDPELRRLGLDDHPDQVRGEDDPEQQVAELGAGGDVRREVAGIDVGDRGDEGRAEERPEPREPAPLPVERAPGGVGDQRLARGGRRSTVGGGDLVRAPAARAGAGGPAAARSSRRPRGRRASARPGRGRSAHSPPSARRRPRRRTAPAAAPAARRRAGSPRRRGSGASRGVRRRPA